MVELSGKYVLQQSYCPSCGVLVDTDLIEEKKEPPPVEEKQPKGPQAKPVAVDPQTTAVLVLDLSARCEDPKLTCAAILAPVAEFLERARVAGAPIVFTISASAVGTPLDRVAAPLKRRKSEPVVHPDAFDKFHGGEIKRILDEWGVKTVIVVGSATNVAVLYTATGAARIHRYDVIVPVDGVNARTAYAHEYALYQLSVLPAGVHRRFRFTTLSSTSFI
jgi:nicotinamidase-related amidase